MTIYFPALVIVSYIIGSIPTSIIAGRILRGIDIRDYGSGNAGATNTARVLGFRVGLVVGLIDIFKGFVPTFFFIQWWGGQTLLPTDIQQILCGLAVILGHIFTIFASFRGGKGVNTALGVFLGLAPLPTFTAIVVWLVIFLSTGYVSLGSITAPFIVPLMILIQGRLFGWWVSPNILSFSLITGFIIIVTHRTNIRRLIRGQENRFSGLRKISGQSKKEQNE